MIDINEKHWIWFPVGFVAVADIITTDIGLRHGLVEGNPIANTAIQSIGLMPASAILKTIVILVCAVMYLRLIDTNQHEVTIPIAISAVWSVAVLNNVYLLMQVSPTT